MVVRTLFFVVLQGERDASPWGNSGLELVELMSRGCHTRHGKRDP